jgi:alpha-L-fucosidase
MPHIAPWFPNAKLGIFVHYGVFKNMFVEDQDRDWEGRRGIPMDEYERRANLFTCDKLDMTDWASHFKRWGARYAVLTSRHAMGFALWNTKVHGRSIVKMAPYGKDLVAQWCDELRKQDLKVGLYFCHRDWGDADFRAEMENEPYAEADPEKKAAAWERYIEKRNQAVIELMGNYGKIDLFWADEDWGRTHEQLRSAQMAHLIESRQPEIVMNNRFCHPYIGHYGSPEQNVPLNPMGSPWEMCDTLIDWAHWQYVKGKKEFKRKEDILRFFIDIIANGGNYLINIGPRPDGTLVEEEVAILDYLGDFCKANAEAIYDTRAGLPRACFGGGSTAKGATVYLFSVDKPGQEFAMRGVLNPIKKITALKTGRECAWRQSGGKCGKGNRYTLITPIEDDSPYPVVYKVEFEGKKLEINKK